MNAPLAMAAAVSAAPEALPAGVALHWCDLDAPEGEGDHFALLSPDEAARAGAFRFDRDRVRFSRARLYLRRVLAAATGAAPGALRFRYGPRGKPALEGAGPWFNLSHSGGVAVLAVSGSGPVGVDVERLDRRADHARLAERVLTPAERAVLLGLPEPQQPLRFLSFWTAKEARMKLTGEGMALEPARIALALRGGWPAGYASPADPPARLIGLASPFPGAVAHAALLAGETA